jgi:hypothetical protein
MDVIWAYPHTQHTNQRKRGIQIKETEKGMKGSMKEEKHKWKCDHKREE